MANDLNEADDASLHPSKFIDPPRVIDQVEMRSGIMVAVFG